MALLEVSVPVDLPLSSVAVDDGLDDCEKLMPSWDGALARWHKLS